MPVTTRPRSAFGTPIVYSKKKKSQAFLAGVAAFGDGEILAKCPEEYKPIMGDSVLFDCFRHGYLAAKTANVL